MSDDFDMEAGDVSRTISPARDRGSPLDTLALTATLLAPANLHLHPSGDDHSLPVVASALPTSAGASPPPPRPFQLTPKQGERGASVGDPRLVCLDEATMSILQQTTHDREQVQHAPNVYSCVCCTDKTKGDTDLQEDDYQGDAAENKRTPGQSGDF